ncbi:MAG TPA: hypothetical protein ENN79_11945, partial [Desulfobacteraceae bacterium]|nr:hypothetical protein [Desulfobacteraceae bacterium]
MSTTKTKSILPFEQLVNPDVSKFYLAFIGASQYLYCEATRQKADANCRKIAGILNDSQKISFGVRYLGLGLDENINRQIIDTVNADPFCVGVIFLAHTFTLSGEWRRALEGLNRVLIVFDTATFGIDGKQLEDIEWADMDLHQGAHGVLEGNAAVHEAGIMPLYLIGDYDDQAVHERLDWLGRIAMVIHLAKHARILNWGKRMNGVRLTYGDETVFEKVFGIKIEYTNPKTVMQFMRNEVPGSDFATELERWRELYRFADGLVDSTGKITDDGLKDELFTAIALRKIMEASGSVCFTHAFEDVGEFKYLPGASVQKLMAEGFGYGPEGHY